MYPSKIKSNDKYVPKSLTQILRKALPRLPSFSKIVYDTLTDMTCQTVNMKLQLGFPTTSGNLPLTAVFAPFLPRTGHTPVRRSPR